MKSKIFPTLPASASFEIVDSLDDELKFHMKKFKTFHPTLMADLTGASQPSIHKALRRLTSQGFVIDKGMVTIRFKGTKQRRYVRLYERV